MTDPAAGPGNALARLTEVSRALTYAVSVDDVLDITVECAADLLDATRVVLMLRGEDDLLQIRAYRGIEPDTAERFREPLDETLISRLDALMGPAAREGFLGVPLVVQGRVTGLLAVLREESGPHTERDEWLLSALADQTGVALDHARSEATRSTLERRLADLQTDGVQREDALRMVGHDLRSPLSALQGYVHLLETGAYGPVTDGQRTALERLGEIARHLESLVSNILEMGRLTAGTLTLDREPVDLRSVAESAETMVTLDAADAGVRITIEIPSGLRVLAATNRLRQVLVQLLDNAVKFAPEDTAVTLTGEPASDDGRVVIRISDRGPGIPPEEAESVFEPYRQLEPGLDGGGFGLGLSIARALVELMGGTLRVDPEVEEGATFVLTLPAV